MKKFKVLLAIVALTAVIAVASVAQAATFSLAAVVATEDQIGTCGSVSLGAAITADEGAAITCAITASSNNPAGTDITFDGSANGLYNGSYEWTKLLDTDDTIDTSCSSGCTEEWGFKLSSVSGLTVQEDTTSNPSTCTGGVDCYDFDDATHYHTVELAGSTDTLFSEAAEYTGSFTVDLGASTSSTTESGTYGETITLTAV
jgi:hypothetical protein